MPFTFTHPAAILPLAYLPRKYGKYFSITGLAIGSLTPDFEYFFRMEPRSVISHTPEGLLLFCLPVGILLSFVFHDIIRNSLIDNLPLFLKSRFYKIKQFDWNKYFAKYWIIVIISILAGAASHVLWDSFTHGQYTANQHPSTLVGAAAIFFAVYKIPKDKDSGISGKISVKYWMSFIILAAVILSIYLLTVLPFERSVTYIGKVIVSGISAGLFSITAISLLWKIKKRRHDAAALIPRHEVY
jgi:hypothetical protein